MIVVRPKNPEEILGNINDFRRILIVGCSGCAATLQVGGKKQSDEMKADLETRLKARGTDAKIATALAPRQCDRHMVENATKQLAGDCDVIVSLGCGVGVQTLSDLFPDKPVIPAVDTMFLGECDSTGSGFRETCRACGDCILFETGGICPTARCAKSLLNGPCGGQVGGKCEAGGWKKDCAWILIYNRLKSIGRLDLFTRFRLPRDYRVSEPPRQVDTRIPAEVRAERSVKLGEIEEAVKKRVAHSALAKQMMDHEFVFTGELEPMKITNLQEIVDEAKMLKKHVTAINITDNPTAFGFVNALVPSYMIQREAGVEAVYQMTARDRNRLALFSDILAAGTLGIRNILVLTGDYTTVGDTPQAKPVFDLDSATFLYMLRKIIDEGTDLNGNRIENPPKFNVGVAASPNAEPFEAEALKIERKVRMGVDFIQTQCVYSLDQASMFLDATAYLKTPVILGLAPFKSLAMMDWMIKYVPGIKVPQELELRLRRAREKSKEDFRDENVRIFAEMVHDIRRQTKTAGLHMMSVGFEWIIPQIVERSETC